MSVKAITSGLIGPQPIREPRPLSYIRSVLQAGIEHKATGMQAGSEPEPVAPTDIEFETTVEVGDVHVAWPREGDPTVQTVLLSGKARVSPPEIPFEVASKHVTVQLIVAVLRHMSNTPLAMADTPNETEFEALCRGLGRCYRLRVPGESGWDALREWVSEDALRRDDDMRERERKEPHPKRLFTKIEYERMVYAHLHPAWPLLVDTVEYLAIVLLNGLPRGDEGGLQLVGSDEQRALLKFTLYLQAAIDSATDLKIRSSRPGSEANELFELRKRASVPFHRLRAVHRRHEAWQASQAWSAGSAASDDTDED